MGYTQKANRQVPSIWPILDFIISVGSSPVQRIMFLASLLWDACWFSLFGGVEFQGKEENNMRRFSAAEP
jgi:hypothetical protein